jgi:hypothetical protein
MMQDEEPAKAKVAGILFSRDPLIVWGPATPPFLAGAGTTLAPYIGNRRAYFLFSPAWTRERDDMVRSDLKHIAQLRTQWRSIATSFFARPALSSALRARDSRDPLRQCLRERAAVRHPAPREQGYDALYVGNLCPLKTRALRRDRTSRTDLSSLF